MHNPQLIAAAALIGAAVATPQNLAFSAIFNAPSGVATGPPLAALSQVSVINTSAQIASISAAVTTAATAAITGAAASNAANISPSAVAKRSLQGGHLYHKRDTLSALLAWIGLQLKAAQASASTASSTTTTSAATATATTTTGLACSALANLATTYTDSTGTKYTLKCGYDYTGVGDLQTYTASSYSDCFTACSNYKGCQAFVFSSGTCYLKSLTGVTASPSAKSGCDLGVLAASASSSSTSSVATKTASTSSTAAVVTTATSATTVTSVTSATTASTATSAILATSTTSVTTATDSGVLNTGAPVVGLAAPINTPTVSTTTGSATIIDSGSATGSGTTSATSACATTPEAGTYCGFINPEDPCAPQPNGTGPAINSPDTVAAFQAYAPFASAAVNAKTPTGYANTFTNLNTSTSATSYMGLWTIPSYNPDTCAALCNNNTGCTSFNIYIERDPSLNPCKNDSTDATVWGYWCPLPASITNYKCTLWGSNIDATTATNAGGWREDFNVVVAGSNGYDKTNVTTPVSVPTYAAPKNCSGAAINGGSYWMGSKFYPGIFNPQLCAAYANATTAANLATALAANKTSYTPCQMFNALHVYKNNIPMGTYCAIYDAQLSTAWASIKGAWSGQNYWGVRNSWQYQLSTPNSGKCGS